MSSCQNTNGSMKTNDIANTTFVQSELLVSVTADISAVTDTTIESTASTKVTEVSEFVDTTNTSVKAAETSDFATIVYNYKYQPPQEVLNTCFYCDNIETKIKLKWIGHDPAGYWYMEDKSYCVDVNNDEYINFLYTKCKEILPNEIVDDMFLYKLETEWSKDLTIVGMGYMLFDLNDDGYEDYIIAEGVSGDGYMTSYLYKMYICSDKDIYIPVKWSCLKQFNDIQYILKTKTNGLRDIMVLHNANYPVITYEGGDSYTPCEMLDERHTFICYEIMSDNILHLNMRVSVIDAPLGEYYTAIKVADNPYIKNNVLYTCYPDGTPRTYTQKPFGESLPTDFAPSIDGYDFYVELTDEGVEATNVSLDILEIKYVAVDDDSR